MPVSFTIACKNKLNLINAFKLQAITFKILNKCSILIKKLNAQHKEYIFIPLILNLLQLRCNGAYINIL